MDLMLFLLVSGLGIGAGLYNWRESWRAEGRRRSSVLARARLRAVIAADREAVQACRWVIDRFRMSFRRPGSLRPIYRWERRR